MLQSKKVSKYADVLTLEAFTLAVPYYGALSPEDGHGYFMSSEVDETNVGVWGCKEIPKWATHVAWYNK